MASVGFLTVDCATPRARRRTLLVWGTAAAYAAATYLAVTLTRNAEYVAAIWPPNAILLAGLLLSANRRVRWEVISAAFASGAAVNLLNGDSWAIATAIPVINATEAFIAFFFLRMTCGVRLDLTKAGTVVTFVGVCLAAALLPAVAGAVLMSAHHGSSYGAAFSTWYLADVLALLILTPPLLLIWQTPRRSEAAPAKAEIARQFLLLSAVLFVVFAQSSMPLLFLIMPISVLIAFRLGPRYTAISALYITIVSLGATYQGFGPAATMGDPDARIWMLQLFCFINLVTSLAVAAELADRERLKQEVSRVSHLAAQQRQQLDTALDAMSQGVCLFDKQGRVVVRNSRFFEIYGLDESAVPIGSSLAELMSACRAAGVTPEGQDVTVQLDKDSDIEQQLVDGRHIRISQRVMGDGAVICTYTDFTAEKRAEGALLHRTLHDVLTGLPNRSLLVERVEHALAAARNGKDVAVMLFDIDYFKSVNDNLGHAAGDEVLRIVAERLSTCVRETDTVARLGGDEFALLLCSEQQSGNNATAVAKRILDEIRKPFDIDGRPVRVGMSIGIARPPSDGATTDDILKAADVALYKAKRNGRGKYAFYNAAEDANACSARRLESELLRAVEDKEFRIVYQPIKTGDSGDVAALEALIRWHHPEFGMISPAEFIPLAERNGLIGEIGDWVLEQACRDAVRLPSNVKISVNLSRVQISDPQFVGRVSATLARTGLAPERLELEVTETAILHDEANASEVLGQLQALGVSVAIDDFGVGQSALSCLKSLPIGRIKIDRSFINDLATDPKARSIFVAVVALAKSLGIQTTAEGIETEQQRIIAALAGCDHLQGYLLGRPEDLDRIALEANAPDNLDASAEQKSA